MLGPIAGWRLNPPFYYGWLALGITALGTFVSTSVGGLVLGGTQSSILEEMRWRRSTIGLAVTVGVWCSELISPVVGSLSDRYGARWLMPFGAACLGISLYFISKGRRRLAVLPDRNHRAGSQPTHPDRRCAAGHCGELFSPPAELRPVSGRHFQAHQRGAQHSAHFPCRPRLRLEDSISIPWVCQSCFASRILSIHPAAARGYRTTA